MAGDEDDQESSDDKVLEIKIARTKDRRTQVDLIASLLGSKTLNLVYEIDPSKSNALYLCLPPAPAISLT
ncbi:hypothetical protein QVD17_01250 [Tagetes erecta]|uniref:Uncharacterized protein n=1 Tax=Tagetes erecta TaxID=13708 RepID=A0AAD8LA94_TARER|nr:hypothetical protein QVD17_01250 [Tagetes erecta]